MEQAKTRPCLRCQGKMAEAVLNPSGGLLMLETPNRGVLGIRGKVSAVLSFVCVECGHIELVAEKPELFR